MEPKINPESCDIYIAFTLQQLTPVIIKGVAAFLIWLCLHLTYKNIPEDI